MKTIENSTETSATQPENPTSQPEATKPEVVQPKAEKVLTSNCAVIRALAAAGLSKAETTVACRLMGLVPSAATIQTQFYLASHGKGGAVAVLPAKIVERARKTAAAEAKKAAAEKAKAAKAKAAEEKAAAAKPAPKSKKSKKAAKQPEAPAAEPVQPEAPVTEPQPAQPEAIEQELTEAAA